MKIFEQKLFISHTRIINEYYQDEEYEYWLCSKELHEVFDFPNETKEIIISIHTKPGVDRIKITKVEDFRCLEPDVDSYEACIDGEWIEIDYSIYIYIEEQLKKRKAVYVQLEY